jgi:hypothetical protein
MVCSEYKIAWAAAWPYDPPVALLLPAAMRADILRWTLRAALPPLPLSYGIGSISGTAFFVLARFGLTRWWQVAALALAGLTVKQIWVDTLGQGIYPRRCVEPEWAAGEMEAGPVLTDCREGNRPAFMLLWIVHEKKQRKGIGASW